MLVDPFTMLLIDDTQLLVSVITQDPVSPSGIAFDIGPFCLYKSCFRVNGEMQSIQLKHGIIPCLKYLYERIRWRGNQKWLVGENIKETKMFLKRFKEVHNRGGTGSARC
jgi:hypothetical protein